MNCMKNKMQDESGVVVWIIALAVIGAIAVVTYIVHH
jgi:hypothetical protein